MTTTASHPPRQRHTKYAARTVSFELVYSHALHARRRDGRCAAHAHVSSRVLSARGARRSRSSSSRIANRAAAASRKPATVVYCYWLAGVVSVSSLRPLPLIANWHIPLQNFPQVDLWGLVLLCVTFLSSGDLQLVTHLSEHWPSAQAQ